MSSLRNTEYWQEKRLYGTPVAVIDFETTGINCDNERVIQVAIVHNYLGMNQSTIAYKGYINPCCAIPPSSMKIHGITNEQVKSAPTFEAAKDDILKHLDGRLLAAYNLPFDFGFLNAELKRLDIEPLSWFGICGLVLAKYVDTQSVGRGYHRLENVAKRRNMTFKAHDAAEDALVTSRLLDTLLGEASKKWGSRFKQVREYWSFQREQGIIQERKMRSFVKGSRGWPWTDW